MREICELFRKILFSALSFRTSQDRNLAYPYTFRAFGLSFPSRLCYGKQKCTSDKIEGRENEGNYIQRHFLVKGKIFLDELLFSALLFALFGLGGGKQNFYHKNFCRNCFFFLTAALVIERIILYCYGNLPTIQKWCFFVKNEQSF